MTKRNAANTPVLRTVKRFFNQAIYQESLHLYNEQGEDAMYKYMQRYTQGDIKQVLEAWGKSWPTHRPT